MANWDHLARSVPMLLSLSLCGLSLAGADVGGFMGDPDLELLVRWHQLGIWYPFYRAHAHLTTKRREPWLFGPETTALIRDSVVTRYQLLPMWYTLAAEWALRGEPILRPMWYHSLGDAAAYPHADDQFFVGDSVIVRAVNEPGSKTVSVYLPDGKWYDFWDERSAAKKGGQTLTDTVHPSRVPVYVRNGHIMVKRMRARRSAGAMIADPYTVVVYGTPAQGRVYIDDGNSHAFQGGAFIYDDIAFDGAVLRVKQMELPKVGSLGDVQRKLPDVPKAGLRVERLVFVGLQQPPKEARVGGSSTTLRVDVTASPQAASTTWTASVRDPATHFGAANGWSVELLF